MRNKVSKIVRNKIKELCPASEANFVLNAFEYADFPLAKEHERIFLAILKISGGDLDRFKKAYELAEQDWRDVLVWAGMENAD